MGYWLSGNGCSHGLPCHSEAIHSQKTPEVVAEQVENLPPAYMRLGWRCDVHLSKECTSCSDGKDSAVVPILLLWTDCSELGPCLICAAKDMLHA